MNATAEPISWVIRVGKDHQKLGDPWDFSVVCTSCGSIAWMCAGHGQIPPRIMKAIGEVLRNLGFTRVEWMRVDDGEFKRTGRDL